MAPGLGHVAAKISVYLQIAYLCSTWRAVGGGLVNPDGPACCGFSLRCPKFPGRGPKNAE